MASTPRGPEEVDRHGWNSLENYQSIHDNRLTNHPFLDPDRPHTVTFNFFDFEGDLYVQVLGDIFCMGGIVVEVVKYLETRERAGGQVQVRGFSYRYHAYIPGKHNLLRYDNGHDDLDEYHKHVWDTRTGQEIERRIISRNELPTLGEMLDELEGMFYSHSWSLVSAR